MFGGSFTCVRCFWRPLWFGWGVGVRGSGRRWMGFGRRRIRFGDGGVGRIRFCTMVSSGPYCLNYIEPFGTPVVPGVVVPFAVGAPCLGLSAFLMLLEADVRGLSPTVNTAFGLPTAIVFVVPKPLAVKTPEWFGVIGVCTIDSPCAQVDSAWCWAQKGNQYGHG